jgi:hypothetical protein
MIKVMRSTHPTPDRDLVSSPLRAPPCHSHLAVHDEGVELVSNLAHLEQTRARANVALADLICAMSGTSSSRDG